MPAIRVASKVPIRLIAITFLYSVEVVRRVVAAVAADGARGRADAGGVHQHPQRRELARGVDGGRDLGRVGDVDVGERAAQLVGQGLALVVLHVGDHDRRPGGGEAAGDGGADARGGPGDDG